ncbi:Cullin-like protein 2 [Elsinoe fawcettii]|nr:Cullin-like protein 2 [Elsinoe fawcettii]
MAVTASSRRAFNDVFPAYDFTLPTPTASPYIGAPSSPPPSSKITSGAATTFSDHQAAFRIVTQWLLTAEALERSLSQALDFLIQEPYESGLERIVDWYEHHIRHYVDTEIKPRLQVIWSKTISKNNAHGVLELSAEHIQAGFDRVTRALSSKPVDSHDATAVLLRTAVQSFNSAIAQCLPPNRLEAVLGYALYQSLHAATFEGNGQGFEDSRTGAQNVVRDIASLRTTFGAAVTDRALARAVQSVVTAHVNQSQHMRVDWVSKTSKTVALDSWIETQVFPAIATDDEATTISYYQKMARNILGQARIPNLLDYVQQWPQSIGAISELKEYTDTSRENKEAIRNALIHQMETRLLHAGATTAELLGIYVKLIHVCFTLSPQGVLLERVAPPLRALLRERSDTVKVIASSFLAELDENNALLSSSGTNPDEVCTAITYEVQRSESILAAPKPPLDWDDMNWQPDPIDAGPDHRLTRHNDVVHFTLSLFERDAFIKEIESILGERLLRSEDETLAIETRLVDMLKNRLGDDRLQAADVMLRDMRDSVRIGAHIASVRSKLPKAQDIYNAIPEQGITFGDLVNTLRLVIPGNQLLYLRFAEVIKEAAVAKPTASKGSILFRNPAYVPSAQHSDRDGASGFEAKVLSAFFWPKLRDDQFKVPPQVDRKLKEFEKEFVAVKRQRKLEWLSALGRVSVELELKDRTVKVDGVKTWVASVAYAFQEADTGGDMDVEGEGVKKSVAQLEEELEMDELLVRNALSFWVGQRVLREVESDVYEVMETLPSEEEEEVSAAPQKEEAVSALKSKTAVLEENKQLYEMFIVGMLTNGGAMDPMRIGMMLNMAMPNGFGYGNDEVVWLLKGLEADGKVEMRGDAWAIKK